MKINDDKNYSPDIDAYHLCSWDNYFIWTDNCEKFLINRLIKKIVVLKKIDPTSIKLA